MKHRGELLENAVRKSGIKLSQLAKKLSISRNTLYNKFGEADLDLDFILEVGKIINYDFAQVLPELSKNQDIDVRDTLRQLVEKEVEEDYTITDCTRDLLQMQRKYIALLEKHTELLYQRNGAA